MQNLFFVAFYVHDLSKLRSAPIIIHISTRLRVKTLSIRYVTYISLFEFKNYSLMENCHVTFPHIFSKCHNSKEICSDQMELCLFVCKFFFCYESINTHVYDARCLNIGYVYVCHWIKTYVRVIRTISILSLPLRLLGIGNFIRGRTRSFVQANTVQLLT